MEIAKKELFKGENLVAVKPFNPKSDEISCISYHDPPPVILVKAKPVKQPDVFKRIVSDGKERWINEEETETTKMSSRPDSVVSVLQLLRLVLTFMVSHGQLFGSCHWLNHVRR